MVDLGLQTSVLRPQTYLESPLGAHASGVLVELASQGRSQVFLVRGDRPVHE